MSAMRILVVDDEADIRGLLKEIPYAEQARAARARQTPGPGAAGYLDARGGWHHLAA